MTTQGIILLDLLGACFIILILNLVRTKKLHASYAVIWSLASVVMMLIISIPILLDSVTRVVGAVFPASAMSLLAFAFIFLVLISFSVQLSLLADRQSALIQELAIRQLEKKEEQDFNDGDVDKDD